jgi:hypothetical protein
MTEGFKLSTWTGSYEALCLDNSQKLFSNSGRIDTLGIIWNPGQDTLTLRTITIWAANKELTKLVFLHIARIFYSAD